MLRWSYYITFENITKITYIIFFYPNNFGYITTESKKLLIMTKQELTSKISTIERFIWDSGKNEIINAWDEYADQLLEQVEYWNNLSPDSLYEAYNQAYTYALKINKDFEKDLNLNDE